MLISFSENVDYCESLANSFIIVRSLSLAAMDFHEMPPLLSIDCKVMKAKSDVPVTSYNESFSVCVIH